MTLFVNQANIRLWLDFFFVASMHRTELIDRCDSFSIPLMCVYVAYEKSLFVFSLHKTVLCNKRFFFWSPHNLIYKSMTCKVHLIFYPSIVPTYAFCQLYMWMFINKSIFWSVRKSVWILRILERGDSNVVNLDLLLLWIQISEILLSFCELN